MRGEKSRVETKAGGKGKDGARARARGEAGERAGAKCTELNFVSSLSTKQFSAVNLKKDGPPPPKAGAGACMFSAAEVEKIKRSNTQHTQKTRHTHTAKQTARLRETIERGKQ